MPPNIEHFICTETATVHKNFSYINATYNLTGMVKNKQTNKKTRELH